MSNYIIRIGYCPSGHGSHKSAGCEWFNDIKDTIKAYHDFRLDKRVPIYIKFDDEPYKQIDYDWLLEHDDISS